MARHRILIVGPPASGRGWLAERIHALTGIALPGPGERPGREWVRIAGTADEAAESVDEADLVVRVRTPAWLRYARVVLRGGSRDAGLLASLRATRRWEADEWPRLAALLERAPHRVMICESSEDVRAVLERVFGIEAATSS